jgi:hypothetical protein
VLHVCEVLRDALHHEGVEIPRKFRRHSGPEAGIDAIGQTAEGSEVRVQVTGVVDQSTMADLGREEQAATRKDTGQLAADILAAVVKKAKSTSEGIILALDAIRSPAHATGEIVKALSVDRFAETLRQSGFEQIWLVGSAADRAYRLHPPRPILLDDA